MLKVVFVDGLQYSTETLGQAQKRWAATAKYNADVERAIRKARKAMREPAKGYHNWCRKHAPHLLED